MVGSGIRKKPIPDPGSGGQKGTGSRIRIRNTAKKHTYLNDFFYVKNIASVFYVQLAHTKCNLKTGAGQGTIKK